MDARKASFAIGWTAAASEARPAGLPGKSQPVVSIEWLPALQGCCEVD